MIRSIELQNFKCFERQSVPLGALTLLSGLNGMGKSTVLQSLLLLRQSRLATLLPDVGLALNGDLVSLGTAADVLYEGAEEDVIAFAHDFSPLNGANERVEWRFLYDRTADVLRPATKPEAAPDGSGSVYNTALFTDHFQYLQAERIGPRTTSDVSEYVVGRHHQLGTRGEYAVHFLHVHGDETIPNKALSHPEATSLSIRAQTEAWLGDVSPGTRFDIAEYRDVDVVRLQYAFVRPGAYASKPFRATNVGFGLSYSLPVLIALLAATSGTLVLVENPEAHLHPRGQLQLGHLAARAAAGGAQVLAETHSDHVLNGVRLAVHGGQLSPDDLRIHFFTRSEGARGHDTAPVARLLSPTVDRDGRIEPWPEGFFDEFDRALLALLAPHR